MDNQDVSLTISQDIVKPIVEAKIKEALIKSFGENKEDVLNRIIDDFLSQKVDINGKVNNYNSENKYSYADILIRKMINSALSDAVKEWAKNNSDKIKDALCEKLNQKTSMKKMANSIMSGLLKATENKWTFSTEFKFESYDYD